MFNLDPAKLFVILVVALIVLGPERLPRLARQLGAGWREFSRVRNQLTEEVRSALPDVDLPRIPYRSGQLTNYLREASRQSGTANQSATSTNSSSPSGAPPGAPREAQAEERGLDDPSMN